VNQWVDFLKQYAKDNNMTYSCAISDKSASVAYKNMKRGGDTRREREEMESMSMEDFDVPIKKVGKTSKNPWIEFLKKYSRENGIKYNEALKEIKQLGLYK